MGSLTGRSALVSGGASGIGRAIASLFTQEGARVVIADKNEELLLSTVEELRGTGDVAGVVGDVSRMEDAERIVRTTLEHHGHLDALVCSAGIPSVSPIGQLTEEEFDLIMSTNVKGTYTIVKCAVPYMVAHGGGTIVTLGSEMGIVAVPESPAYNASKGAIIMFSKSIALDLIHDNIRVNVLCPGITQTPLLDWERNHSADPTQTAEAQAQWAPILRIADPMEMAQGALFLTTDASSFAVGSCLVLDGGQTAR